MRVTSKGLTILTGACNWAGDYLRKRVTIEDLELSYHPGAGDSTFTVVLEHSADSDEDIIGTGHSFLVACEAFAFECKSLACAQAEANEQAWIDAANEA